MFLYIVSLDPVVGGRAVQRLVREKPFTLIATFLMHIGLFGGRGYILISWLYWPVTDNEGFDEAVIVACRLLDMGFEKDISRVVLALDEHDCQRQTVLLSATLTAGQSPLT